MTGMVACFGISAAPAFAPWNGHLAGHTQDGRVLQRKTKLEWNFFWEFSRFSKRDSDHLPGAKQ
jgi:hypothetical protein